MGHNELFLLRKKIFLPLFITQFCGALNDNAFKLSMLTLISYHLSVSQNQSELYQVLAGGLFILPFFLFSATAGQLADQWDKAFLTKIVKGFECILMIIGGFALFHSSIVLMMLVLTGMGVHSTFFGPIKYAILPDLLQRDQLLPATALIEASTFLAILLGTTLGALTMGGATAHIGFSIAIVNVVALIGLVASFFIPKAPSTSRYFEVDWHLWRATKNMMKSILTNRQLLPAVLAISWFWLIGAVVMTKLPDYTHYVLGADTSVFALFLALFSVGIAFGSLAISYLLKGRITLYYVPLAMFFLSFFIVDLYWATPNILPNAKPLTLTAFLSSLNHWRITLDFFLFSFCSGLFVVPLYAYLQVSCEEGARARLIAANNIISALAMVVGSLLVMVMLQLNITIGFVFLVLALLNMVVATILWFALRVI